MQCRFPYIVAIMGILGKQLAQTTYMCDDLYSNTMVFVSPHPHPSSICYPDYSFK